MNHCCFSFYFHLPNLKYGLVWNTVVISDMVLQAVNRICWINLCNPDDSTLAACFEPLAHR